MTIVFSLMFGAGVAMWVATKVARRTGNADAKSTALTAGLAGLFAFVFFLTLFKFVLGM
jgi:hypothetical protein